MSEYIELPMRGLEEPLSEEERAVQDTVHRFAVDVIRPVAAKLDRLTAKEMVDPSSKLWDVLRKSADLGISLIDLEELEPIQRDCVARHWWSEVHGRSNARTRRRDRIEAADSAATVQPHEAQAEKDSGAGGYRTANIANPVPKPHLQEDGHRHREREGRA